MKIKKKLRH